MPRVRTTKALAQRIDLSYFKRPHPLRSARLALVVLSCILAVALWGIAAVRGHRMMYNPGAVASVHAMWGANCSACHDAGRNGGGGAGFSRSVSDAACLKCHDGSMHHPNQLTLITTAPDGRVRSASCASCHVEHRGHDALLAADDSHCLQCHADLSHHSRQPPVVAASVSLFDDDVQHHPRFGRSLTADAKFDGHGGSWVDPTVLWFNHKMHMTKVASRDGSAENCTVCHMPQRPVTSTTRPAPAPLAGDGRYMQPVNYYMDCSTAGCHPITSRSLKGDLKPLLLDDVSLPHADLDTVRSTVQRYLQPTLSADKFEGPGAKPAGTGGGGSRLPGRRPAPAAQAAGPAPISKAEWVRQNARFILDKINNERPPSFPAFAGTIPEADSIPATGDAPAIDDATFVDLYVAYVALNQCNKCHLIEGDFPSLAGTTSALKPLRTVPTGIPAAPRRWFVHSTFDHRSHRNLACTSCHVAAPQSEKTPDVLSPDIDWKDAQGRQASCADCHRPATFAAVGSASNNCITCHVFHDRAAERWPPGAPTLGHAIAAEMQAPPTTRSVQ